MKIPIVEIKNYIQKIYILIILCCVLAFISVFTIDFIKQTLGFNPAYFTFLFLIIAGIASFYSKFAKKHIEIGKLELLPSGMFRINVNQREIEFSRNEILALKIQDYKDQPHGFYSRSLLAFHDGLNNSITINGNEIQTFKLFIENEYTFKKLVHFQKDLNLK